MWPGERWRSSKTARSEKRGFASGAVAGRSCAAASRRRWKGRGRIHTDATEAAVDCPGLFDSANAVLQFTRFCADTERRLIGDEVGSSEVRLEVSLPSADPAYSSCRRRSWPPLPASEATRLMRPPSDMITTGSRSLLESRLVRRPLALPLLLALLLLPSFEFIVAGIPP